MATFSGVAAETEVIVRCDDQLDVLQIEHLAGREDDGIRVPVSEARGFDGEMERRAGG